MNLLVNFLAYQFVWFACVFGAIQGMPWLGTGSALAVAALHLRLTGHPRRELGLMIVAAATGFALDSTLASNGLVSFASGVWVDGLAPHWMVALWIGFATTLNVSLRWLTSRPVLAAAFGAVGGPLAYYAGMRLGALQLQPLDIALAAVGVGWALAMWLLAMVAGRIGAVRRLKEGT